MTRDDGSVLALETAIVSVVVLAAAAYVLSESKGPTTPTTARDDVVELLDDATRILAGLPSADGRASAYLEEAVAWALAGDDAPLRAKLASFLPTGAAWNAYLDNGYSARDLVWNRAGDRERATAELPFSPSWNFAYAWSDFRVHSTGPGTPLTAHVVPVWHGRHLPPGTQLPNGGFEADGDGNGVPEGWTPSATATAALVPDGSDLAWRLSRTAAGVGATASTLVLVDEDAGLRVKASLKGAAACVQVRWLDASKGEISVDGGVTRCMATLPLASPTAWVAAEGRHFPSNPDVRYAQVELALLQGGEAYFDEVEVLPVPSAVAADGSLLAALPESDTTYAVELEAGPLGYTVGMDPSTDLLLPLKSRYRWEGASVNLAYRASDAALLPVVWSTAQAGLDASTLTLAVDETTPGGTVDVSWNFQPYVDALAGAGVTVETPKVVVRAYEPVPGLAGQMTLARELAPSTALAGSVAYRHSAGALYGPTLLTATVEGDWTLDGFAPVAEQAATKGAVFETVLAPGRASAGTGYRVVLEAWFEEWN